jgi:hypothetical protein
MPKRDGFMQSSFARSLCSRKRSAAESGGTRARLPNSCAIRTSVSMLTPHCSSWAINALLFDYRSNYRRSRFRESRAIIEKWGDYRTIGGSVPTGSECHRRMARRCGIGRSRSCGLRFDVDSLNEFECQLPDGWSHQQAQCERDLRAQYHYRVRLDRRNAVPVEEFRRGRNFLRHQRNEDTGTIQSARGVGSNQCSPGINAGMPIEPSVAVAVALFRAGSSRRGLHFRPCNWCSPRAAVARPRRT